MLRAEHFVFPLLKPPAGYDKIKSGGAGKGAAKTRGIYNPKGGALMNSNVDPASEGPRPNTAPAAYEPAPCFCVNCGHNIPAPNRFCGMCGAAAVTVAPPPERSSLYVPPAGRRAASVPVAPPARPADEKPQRVFAAAISLVALYVLLIGLSYIFLLTPAARGFLRRSPFDPGSVFYMSMSACGVLFCAFLTGCGLYGLNAKRRGAGKSVVFLFLFCAFLATFQRYFITPAAFASTGIWLNFADKLIFAAVAVTAGSIALSGSGPRAGKRIIPAAFVAAAAGFAYRLTGGLGVGFGVFQGPLGYFPELFMGRVTNLNAWINVIFIFLSESAAIVLSAAFAASLGRMPEGRLKTGAGAKVWFALVLLVNAASVVYGFFNTETLNIVDVFFSAAALTGVVLLWGGSRAGRYVFLLPVGMSTAVAYRMALTGYAVVGRSASLLYPNYLTALIVLIYILNPVINELVIRRAWRRI